MNLPKTKQCCTCLDYFLPVFAIVSNQACCLVITQRAFVTKAIKTTRCSVFMPFESLSVYFEDRTFVLQLFLLFHLANQCDKSNVHKTDQASKMAACIDCKNWIKFILPAVCYNPWPAPVPVISRWFSRGRPGVHCCHFHAQRQWHLPAILSKVVRYSSHGVVSAFLQIYCIWSLSTGFQWRNIPWWVRCHLVKAMAIRDILSAVLEKGQGLPLLRFPS